MFRIVDDDYDSVLRNTFSQLDESEFEKFPTLKGANKVDTRIMKIFLDSTLNPDLYPLQAIKAVSVCFVPYLYPENYVLR